MIDISQWLIGLGVVSLGTHPINNQYDFYRNVQWSDGTFTHNQKEFFDKIGQSRYEHFKQYVNEREFYRNTNVPVIKDFYTFYKYAQQYISLYDYLLEQYPGAMAAYSLTKLDPNYTGSAIQVRRDSDNTVLDIGFTPTNLLDTAALTNFCNQDVDVYVSDFSVTEDLTETNAIGSAANTIGGVSDAYKLETVAGGNGIHQAKITLAVSKTFNISFDYYIPSTNSVVDQIKLQFPFSDETFLGGVDSWQTANLTLQSTTSPSLLFNASANNVVSLNVTGDVFYLKNITVTQTSAANGLVTKWYDQSGNGFDATNTSAANQPKIFDATNGIILENGKPALLFENAQVLRNDFGSGSTLEKSLIFVANEYSTSDIFAPVVDSYDETPNQSIFTGRNNADFITIGATITNGFATYADTQILSFTNVDSSGNVVWNIDSGQVATGTTTIGYNGISLGAIRERSSLYYMRGTIQEVIYYLSDQSSNRVDIEDNINNRYSIYP